MRLLKTIGSDRPDWETFTLPLRGKEYVTLSRRWGQNPNKEARFSDIEIIECGSRLLGDEGIVYNHPFSSRSARGDAGISKVEGVAMRELHDEYHNLCVDTLLHVGMSTLQTMPYKSGCICRRK